MAGSENEWKGALVRGKGLTCLQICVGSVTKALQPPLDVLSRNDQVPQFSGTNSVVQNIALLLLHGALADTCGGATWMSSLSSCVWPLLSSGHFYRVSPIGCLTIFSLSVDLKEAVT